MKGVLAYTIGTLLMILIAVGTDIACLIQGGEVDKVSEILSIIEWVWFPLSLVAIVFFVMQKAPIRLPVAVLVYYLISLVIAVILAFDPAYNAHPSKVPTWIFVFDLVINAFLTYLAISLLSWSKNVKQSVRD